MYVSSTNYFTNVWLDRNGNSNLPFTLIVVSNTWMKTHDHLCAIKSNGTRKACWAMKWLCFVYETAQVRSGCKDTYYEKKPTVFSRYFRFLYKVWKQRHTLAKTEIIYPKNVGAPVAMIFTQDKHLAPWNVEKMKILGALLELQSNLAIRNGLIRNKLVLRNHFLWPICHLIHNDKELLALGNNFSATK